MSSIIALRHRSEDLPDIFTRKIESSPKATLMHGCDEPSPPSPGWEFKSVREVPEMREIISSLGIEVEKPLAIIRDTIGSLPSILAESQSIRPHLKTALTLCNDVAELNRRYFDYLDQVQALPSPEELSVRLDDLVSEIDRQIVPDAFGRGIIWSSSIERPIRQLQTDQTLLIEALLEWASLAVECAKCGDLVSLTISSDKGTSFERIRITLASTANELVTNFSNLCEDPLFSRIVCLDEVGTDPGSRLALSIERLLMIGIELLFECSVENLICAVHFLVPGQISQ